MEEITLSEYRSIKVGDTLTLVDVNDSNSIIKEKVTSINNNNSSDTYFQVCTENYSYDFTNFFYITSINQSRINR